MRLSNLAVFSLKIVKIVIINYIFHAQFKCLWAVCPILTSVSFGILIHFILYRTNLDFVAFHLYSSSKLGRRLLKHNFQKACSFNIQISNIHFPILNQLISKTLSTNTFCQRLNKEISILQVSNNKYQFCKSQTTNNNFASLNKLISFFKIQQSNIHPLRSIPIFILPNSINQYSLCNTQPTNIHSAILNQPISVLHYSTSKYPICNSQLTNINSVILKPISIL